MTIQEKKLKLAKALEKELETLPEFNAFGEENNIEDSKLAIRYLKDGIVPVGYPGKYDDFELLYGVIEDFDRVCRNYDIE